MLPVYPFVTGSLTLSVDEILLSRLLFELSPSLYLVSKVGIDTFLGVVIVAVFHCLKIDGDDESQKKCPDYVDFMGR